MQCEWLEVDGNETYLYHLQVVLKHVQRWSSYWEGAMNPTLLFFKFVNRRGFNVEFGTEFEEI